MSLHQLLSFGTLQTYNNKNVSFSRSVAQPGSASRWGCEGRGFKSRRSDHFSPTNLIAGLM